MPFRRSSASGAAQNARRAALAASVASVIFGASVVATRFVVAQTQPVSLAFLRYLIATVCLLPVLRTVWRTGMPRRDLFAIAALGVLFFGLFPWSFSASLTYLPSSRVAVLVATNPLITLAISRLCGIDQLTGPKVAGQALAFVGLVLALHQPGVDTISAADTCTGIGLALVTAGCGATFNVFSRPYLRRYPPLHVAALAMAAGALSLAPIAASQGLFTVLPAVTRGGWAAVLFLGVFGGALGFSLWIWALQRSTPSQVAVFIALNPVTAVLLGAVLLHEPITAFFLTGLVCVIGGIALANWRPAPVRLA